MAYLVLADVTMVGHFAFIAFVVTGGFLAWRWGRILWLHVAAVVWAAINMLGVACPLTVIEEWARHQAGEGGLGSQGFIAHYLTGVIYPESQLATVRGLVVAAILASWAGFAWTHTRLHHTA